MPKSTEEAEVSKTDSRSSPKMSKLKEEEKAAEEVRDKSLMAMFKLKEEDAEEVKDEPEVSKSKEGEKAEGEVKDEVTDRSFMAMFKSKDEDKKEVEEEAKKAKTDESLIDKAKNYVAEKIANVPMPEATVAEVHFKKVSFDSADYLAKVNVYNPYSYRIPICEINYTLKSIGSVIASGRIPDPGSLKASGDTLVDVPVKVPHSIIVTLIKDIATDGDIDYELELGFIFDLPVIGNITIPLTQTGVIKLPSIKELMFGAKEEGKDSEEEKEKDSKEKKKEKDSKDKDKDSD